MPLSVPVTQAAHLTTGMSSGCMRCPGGGGGGGPLTIDVLLATELRHTNRIEQCHDQSADFQRAVDVQLTILHARGTDSMGLVSDPDQVQIDVLPVCHLLLPAIMKNG